MRNKISDKRLVASYEHILDCAESLGDAEAVTEIEEVCYYMLKRLKNEK